MDYVLWFIGIMIYYGVGHLICSLIYPIMPWDIENFHIAFWPFIVVVFIFYYPFYKFKNRSKNKSNYNKHL